jgi:type I restriction enzyme R subunit
MTPEQKARVSIDTLLAAAGWHVCNVSSANLHAATSVAIREFPLNNGFGFADYLLYVNGKACGVIEAKKEGATFTGVEVQSGRYAQGLPASLPAWRRPLPFLWESIGFEKRLVVHDSPMADQAHDVSEVDANLPRAQTLRQELPAMSSTST